MTRNSGPRQSQHSSVLQACLRNRNCTGAGEHSQDPQYVQNSSAWIEHDPRYVSVVAGGAVDDADKGPVQHGSLVIAADSGAEFLRKHDLAPDIIVGDFDSSDPETIAYFRNRGHVEIVSLKRDKDKTDTEVALDLALKKGFTTAIVTGAMRGSRIDHELANLFLIEHYARQGMDLILHSQDTVIFGISGLNSEYCATYGPAYGANSDETPRIMHYQGKRAFYGKPSSWVTILPVTCYATGVTTSNLKFPLYNATLQRGSTLGVSNEMLERTASISIAKGFAVVILSRRSRSS